MNNLRVYGNAPYHIAVIHGGPGAPGEMAPVAREISNRYGVLEPLQTKTTLKGQLEELRKILANNGGLPVILIGHSWGAMLGFIFTAEYPEYVNKLIMISSGVFEDRYEADIMKIRLGRMSEEERMQLNILLKDLNNPAVENRDSMFAQFGNIMSRIDSYSLLPHENDIIEFRHSIYEGVWRDFKEMRSSGRLMELGNSIECSVVAIHGDYDSHPFEKIRESLSGVLRHFRFIILQQCGHYPWYERYAREQFFTVLKKEIQEGNWVPEADTQS